MSGILDYFLKKILLFVPTLKKILSPWCCCRAHKPMFDLLYHFLGDSSCYYLCTVVVVGSVKTFFPISLLWPKEKAICKTLAIKKTKSVLNIEDVMEKVRKTAVCCGIFYRITKVLILRAPLQCNKKTTTTTKRSNPDILFGPMSAIKLIDIFRYLNHTSKINYLPSTLDFIEMLQNLPYFNKKKHFFGIQSWAQIIYFGGVIY